MAIWVPSALVSDIRGLLGNQVFSFQKGVHYIKTHNPAPYNPQTAAQQASRNNFAEISAWWYGLTDEQQQMWHKFASLQERHLSGYNAFVGVNMALYTSGIPSPPRRNHPPLTPDTPTAVREFNVYSISPTINAIVWTAPDDGSLYVQTWKSFDWNYFSTYNQMWVIQAATISTGLGYVHVHDTPIGARIWYRLRSIDLWGRQSPFTHTIKHAIV